MSDSSGGGGGGGGPFGASIPGVSLSTSADAPSTAADGNAADGGQQAPRQRARGQQAEQQGIPSPKRVQAPPRERPGSFAPWKQNQSIDVAEVPEDSSDPFSGLVDRNLAGNKGQELARAPAQNIRDEQAEVAELADPNYDPNAAEESAYEAEAQVLDHDEADEEIAGRYEAWKKLAEQWEALNKGDDIPDALHAKFVAVPVLDEEGRPTSRMTKVTVEELKRNRLRQADYTRKLDEIYRYRAQLEQTDRGMQQVHQALAGGNPAHFLTMIEYLQAFPTFHAAALMYGERLDQERRMSPEQLAMMQALRRSEAEKQRLAVRARALEQQVQQVQQVQQQPADVGYYHNQLAQMIPRAFEQLDAEGMNISGLDWQSEGSLLKEIFSRHMRVFTHDFDGELSTEKLKNVLRGVMEEAQDFVARGWVQQPQPQAARQLPPVSQTRGSSQPNTASQRAGVQAGAPNFSNGRTPKRARLSDISNINRMPTR